jgi:ankyrin repeat protein
MGDLDREGRSALHYASLEGDVARVRALIDEGEDVSLADRGGMTPLHFAAQERHPEVAEALLAAGASVDAPDEHGNSPLFTAVFNARGDGAVINLLRAAGADPWRVNRHGQSPVGLLIANYDNRRFFDDLPDAPCAVDGDRLAYGGWYAPCAAIRSRSRCLNVGPSRRSLGRSDLLGSPDLNRDSGLQRPESCHWTTPQSS